MDSASPPLEADIHCETEIELKLTTSPGNLTKLLKIVSNTDGVDPQSRETKRIVSTYFDTEDRRLRKKGLTLRVREKGGEKEQTVKSEGTAFSGVFRRQEWTTVVKGKRPDLTLIKSSALHERMGLVLPQELSPLFKTDVKRTTIDVHHSTASGDSAKIELAFDRGRLVAGKTKHDISEVELELLSGANAALTDLARILTDSASTVLSLSSKVERGFELCDGTAPQATTAYKLKLPKNATVEDGMSLIFRSALSHLLMNRAAAVSGKDMKGVHQVRVANRRIKSAISIFHNILSSSDTTAFKADANWMLDTLGPARDLDVFIDEVIYSVMVDRPNDPELAALLKAAKKARTGAYRKVKLTLSSARYTRAVLSLSAWIEDLGWRVDQAGPGLSEPLQTVASKLSSHRQRKVLKLGRKFKTLSADERHNVRIALKQLRYASEFFANLYPNKKTRSYVSNLKNLQNALGAANDVSVAEDVCKSLVASIRRGTKDSAALQSAAGKVLGWHSRAASEAEESIVKHWKIFAKSRPFWLSS